MTNLSVALTPKRKRGRPRKHGFSISTSKPALKKTRLVEVLHPNPANVSIKTQQVDTSPRADGMIGRMINGVIEGSFDAGYFVSMRMGNNSGLFRGAVFQPGKFVPFTRANEVAPQAKMYTRRALPFPGVYGNLESHQETSRISPRSDNSSSQPFVFGNCSTFTEPKSTFPRTSSFDGSLMTSSYLQLEQHKSTTAPTQSTFGNQNPIFFNEMEHNQTDFAKVEAQGPMIELQEIPMVFEFHPVRGGEAITGNKQQQSHQYELEIPDINSHPNLFIYPEESHQPEIVSATFHQTVGGHNVSRSPSQDLDLLSSIVWENNHLQTGTTPNIRHEETNHLASVDQNLGYYQSLIEGNPVLIRPGSSTSTELIMDPFMKEKSNYQ